MLRRARPLRVAQHGLAVGPAREDPVAVGVVRDRLLRAQPVVQRMRIATVLRREHVFDRKRQDPLSPHPSTVSPRTAFEPCGMRHYPAPSWPPFPRSRRSKASRRSGAPLGGRRHLPLRSHEDPRRDLRHRHAAADGLRRAAHRPLRVVHPQGPHGPLLAHARQRGLLPDGLGRQRPQRRAPRAADARRAVRPVAPLRPRLHAGRSAAEAADPGVAAQLHADLRRRRRDARGEVPRAVVDARAVGRLVAVVHDDRPEGRGASRSTASSGCSNATSPTAPRRRRCGTST